VEAAKQALAKEEHSIAASLAAYFKRRADGSGVPGEREPDRDTPTVQALKTAVYAAKRDAAPFLQAVGILQEQIDGLRADAPVPDAAVLAVLARAMIGGHRDPD
jgi:hypothetical protein